jgi:hypothetical protein
MVAIVPEEADTVRTPQPTKPLDCFTDEEKRWAVEKIKTELPDAWERLVRRQASCMGLYTPSDDEKSKWTLDQVLESRLIGSLPFDYGNDGWESNRKYILTSTYVDAALAEAKRRYLRGE